MLVAEEARGVATGNPVEHPATMVVTIKAAKARSSIRLIMPSPAGPYQAAWGCSSPKMRPAGEVQLYLVEHHYEQNHGQVNQRDQHYPLCIRFLRLCANQSYRAIEHP